MEDKIDYEPLRVKFSHYLVQEATDLYHQDEAIKWTIQLYNEHFALRQKHNGGGGYFGPSAAS